MSRGGSRSLAAPDLALEALLDLARELAFDRVEIRLPSQMPFVRVPEVRSALAARGLRCGAVACDARPNAPGRLKDGVDSLRQAARAAASLGAPIVPFALGSHDERDDARATGLVGRELKAVAALAAEVGVRLAIERGRAGPGVDPSRTLDGALRLIAAAGSPRALGLVVPAAERGSVPLPAEPLVFALREDFRLPPPRGTAAGWDASVLEAPP